jgi:hypothetical protein
MEVQFERIAPVLPVRSVKNAIDHYRRLGFAAEAYNEAVNSDPIYGFVQRGAIQFHLSRTPDLKTGHNSSACYVYVDDADALYAEWQTLSVGGKLQAPTSTPYRLREFVYWDPDGNLIRVGSPDRLAK